MGVDYRVGGDDTRGVKLSWLCVIVMIVPTRGLGRVRGVGVREVSVGVGGV